MKIKIVYIFLFLFIYIFSASAGEQIIIGGLNGISINEEPVSYPVALAISGGGARGLTTIGILKAFEENNITVAAIAGVSMGSVIGGLYASGYTPDELKEITAQLAFDSLFSNKPERSTMFLTQREEHSRHLFSVRFDKWRPIIPKELTKGQKITSLLTFLTTKANYLSNGDFNQLPIPFKTIATDIITGKEVILEKGSLADAMKASMAFPLAFSAVEKGNYMLMDGGMLRPIPVELARTISDTVNFVVAINTASRLLPQEELLNPFDIANQVTTIMTSDKLQSQLQLADIIITPPIDKFKSSNFEDKDTLIAIGYRSGLAVVDSIKQMLNSRRKDKSYFIKQVRCINLSDTNTILIEKYFEYREITRKHMIDFFKHYYYTNKLFEVKARLIPATSINITNSSYILEVTEIPEINISEYSFHIDGNFIYNDSVLFEQFHFTDPILTPIILRKNIEMLKEFYKTSDIDLAGVKRVDIDSGSKTIRVIIDEGIIRGIDMENNVRSRDWFIRSYFPLSKGEPYSTAKASEGIANIYGTDLYNQVSLRLDSHPDGALVKIGVEEKKYQQVRFGWHWDDEFKSEEFLEYLDDNVLGMGLEYLFHARYATDRQNYFGTFKSNRLWSTYLTAQVKGWHTRLDRQQFDIAGNETYIRQELKTGISFSLGQQIARFGSVNSTITFEHDIYKSAESGLSSSFDLRSFSMTSSVDNLDRIPFPTKGTMNLFKLEIAGKFLGGDEEYTRFNSEMEVYIPLNRSINYRPKLILGLSSSGLPLSEKFYTGGLHSFAGFRTYQLHGDKLFLFSNQIRFKLPYKLYFSIRHDLGNVYNHTDEFKARNLRNGAGFIISFDSPIGPFELGYGFADDDIDRYYINIGLNF